MVINLTSEAKEKLDELFPEMEENKSLKIYIAGYGWGGPSFGMALEEPEEEDLKINVKGYDFIMDKELEEAYGQFTVGYSNSFLRKGFVITQDRGGGSC